MAKKVEKLLTNLGGVYNIPAKLLTTHNPGARIAPSQTSRNDENFQIRLDAGELIEGRYLNVNLQVNRQAKDTALKEWVQKNGTHATLATGRFDTKAEDSEAEWERLKNVLYEEGKEKLG